MIDLQCAYYFSTGCAHDGPKFTNTITQKNTFHNISISQHLQKTQQKTFTKKELQRHQPKRAHQPNAKLATQENNEYLVQQQTEYCTGQSVNTKHMTKWKRQVKTNNIKQTENVSKVTFVCTARKHTVSTLYAASTIHASMQHITHNIDKICTEQDQATRCTVSAVKHAALMYMEINTQQLSAAKIGHFTDAQ